MGRPERMEVWEMAAWTFAALAGGAIVLGFLGALAWKSFQLFAWMGGGA